MKNYKSLKNGASSSFSIKEEVIDCDEDDDDLDTNTSGLPETPADSSNQESEEDSKTSCTFLSETLCNAEDNNSEFNNEGKKPKNCPNSLFMKNISS